MTEEIRPGARNPDVTLREYIEAMLNERDRATERAATEREKAAAALRETLRADLVAGDKALEQHINAQIESVRLALASAEKFSDEVRTSQKEAIDKALEALNKRLDLLNAFRQQTVHEQKTFPSREVVDGKFDALEKEINELRRAMDSTSGFDEGKAEAAIKQNRLIIVVAGFIVTFINTAIILVATSP